VASIRVFATIIAEALPVVDLVPSWTLAAMFVTRNRSKPPELTPEARSS